LNYQSATIGSANNRLGRPLLRLQRLRAELNSNSVGPELTQERANKLARRRQNPSITETPPEADHHREPTHTAHGQKSSTKVAQQERGTKQALPKIARRRVTSATQPSESRVLWAPRWCLQEEHDTGVPPPPDPRILGFHPDEAEKRRLASQRLQKGKIVLGPRRRGQEGQRFPLGKITTFYPQHSPSRPPRHPHGRGHRPAQESLARPPTNMNPTFQGYRPGIQASRTAELNRATTPRNPSTSQGGTRPHRRPLHADCAVNGHLQLARSTTTAVATYNARSGGRGKGAEEIGGLQPPRLPAATDLAHMGSIGPRVPAPAQELKAARAPAHGHTTLYLARIPPR
jgi:hypothetical protein